MKRKIYWGLAIVALILVINACSDQLCPAYSDIQEEEQTENKV
ncbi:MAG: hypothetical protein ACLFUC_10130 [Bacteroidales bacterium]